MGPGLQHPLAAAILTRLRNSREPNDVCLLSPYGMHLLAGGSGPHSPRFQSRPQGMCTYLMAATSICLQGIAMRNIVERISNRIN